MLPKRPPALSPRDQRCWNADDLAQERTHVFTVCEGYGSCSSFCPAFPVVQTLELPNAAYGLPPTRESRGAP